MVSKLWQNTVFFCMCVFCLCFSVFSVCVHTVCFLCVFLCVFSVRVFVCVFLCVFSVCVFFLCFCVFCVCVGVFFCVCFLCVFLCVCVCLCLFLCVCVCVLLLASFCGIQLLKGCISMTAIISAVHGTVFRYSLHFGSILSRLLTLLISRLISNISFIQLSSLLSGYPASSFNIRPSGVLKQQQ